MRTRACEILNSELNTPDSKYGSTRSTLFGKFYERIISKWLEEKQGYQYQRHSDKSPKKPRIYKKDINLDLLNSNSTWILKKDVQRSLKSSRSHWTLDGALLKGSHYSIWEAKNWPLWPEKGPIPQIKSYFIANPWLFANIFTLSNEKYQISEFIFSYWYIMPEEKQYIEQEINKIIGEDKFRIILTLEVIDECIEEPYEWYKDIVNEEKCNIDKFFKQLLGDLKK